MLAPALLFSILLGPAPSSLEPRVAAAVARLCPCRGDAACEHHHARAAHAIAVVAADDARPVDAAIKLLASGAHESGFRVEVQVGGPAVTYWQLEVPRAERAALLADPVAAARRALAAARHGWASYACGGLRCPREAAALRSYEVSAWWAWAAP